MHHDVDGFEYIIDYSSYDRTTSPELIKSLFSITSLQSCMSGQCDSVCILSATQGVHKPRNGSRNVVRLALPQLQLFQIGGTGIAGSGQTRRVRWSLNYRRKLERLNR